MEIIQKIRIGNIVPAIAAGTMFLGDGLIWGEQSQPAPVIDYEQEYFTVTNIDSKSITVDVQAYSATSSLSKIAYKKSTDSSWTEVTRGSTKTNTYIQLGVGESVKLKGTGTSFQSSPYAARYGNRSNIDADGKFEVSGNLWSLILWDSFYGATISPTQNDMWATLFQSRSSGKSNYCTDAHNLIIEPSTMTIMSAGCFSRLFQDNSYIKRGPKLSFSSIASYGYWMMYDRASSVEEVTCLATSGINISKSTGGDNGGWMYGVPATGTFYKAAGVTWPRNGYGIPSGWTVVEV